MSAPFTTAFDLQYFHLDNIIIRKETKEISKIGGVEESRAHQPLGDRAWLSGVQKQIQPEKSQKTQTKKMTEWEEECPTSSVRVHSALCWRGVCWCCIQLACIAPPLALFPKITKHVRGGFAPPKKQPFKKSLHPHKNKRQPRIPSSSSPRICKSVPPILQFITSSSSSCIHFHATSSTCRYIYFYILLFILLLIIIIGGFFRQTDVYFNFSSSLASAEHRRVHPWCRALVLWLVPSCIYAALAERAHVHPIISFPRNPNRCLKDLKKRKE